MSGNAESMLKNQCQCQSKIRMLQNILANVKKVCCAHQVAQTSSSWFHGPALKVADFAVFFDDNSDIVIAFHADHGTRIARVEVSTWCIDQDTAASQIAEKLANSSLCVACVGKEKE